MNNKCSALQLACVMVAATQTISTAAVEIVCVATITHAQSANCNALHLLFIITCPYDANTVHAK